MGGVMGEGKPYARAVVFTGHRIDAAGRPQARFPASAETRAKEAIRAAVIAAGLEGTVGIAAGANGGDILFHEVCGELGVPTEMWLGVPIEEFVRRSVEGAGDEWVRRFWAVAGRVPVSVVDAGDGNVWARANDRMLRRAEELAPVGVLVALWDGKGGDGPGGTEAMVRVAEGFKVRVIAVAGWVG